MSDMKSMTQDEYTARLCAADSAGTIKWIVGGGPVLIHQIRSADGDDFVLIDIGLGRYYTNNVGL